MIPRLTRDLAERMNTTSATVPYGTDEFTLAGLTPVASRHGPACLKGRASRTRRRTAASVIPRRTAVPERML